MSTCANCRYWLVHERTLGEDGEPDDDTIGLCVRFPPRPEVTPFDYEGSWRNNAIFPTTYVDQFCGEHAERANA